MVATKPSAGLSRKFSGRSAGPRPPFSVMAWHEPQSWRTRCTNSFCRSASGSTASTEPDNRDNPINQLLADNDNPLHFWMRTTMIVVTPGLFEASLPAFLREHPLGFQATLLRKEHRMAGPLFMVGPANAVANPDCYFGWLKFIAFDTNIDNGFSLHRKRKERPAGIVKSVLGTYGRVWLISYYEPVKGKKLVA